MAEPRLTHMTRAIGPVNAMSPELSDNIARIWTASPTLKSAGLYLFALAIGLLIGLERERRKGAGSQRKAAGIRTFALLSLSGAIAASLNDMTVLIAGVFTVCAMVVSYQRTSAKDPGLTTEVAMLAALLLGVLSYEKPALAGAAAVFVVLILSGKDHLHKVAVQLLSEAEARDLLVLAVCAFLLLPLLPNHTLDPWHTLNPRKLWLLAVAIMAIGAVGHFALKLLGTKGLAIAGLAGGFVSSTATIVAMGHRAKAHPSMTAPAASAALMSNVGTIVQLAIVLGTFSPAFLHRLLWPLMAAGGAAVVSAWIANRRAAGHVSGVEGLYGEGIFALPRVFGFVAVLAGVMLAAGFLREVLGSEHIIWIIGLSGLADVHAAAASAASLDAAASITASQADLGLLAAFGTNSLLKCGVGWFRGSAAFARQLVPGVVAIFVSLAVVLLAQRAWVGMG